MNRASMLIHRASEPINVAAFEREIALSHTSLDRRDTAATYMHLDRAHFIAHESLPHHIQVHKAMLSVAVMERKAGKVIAELYSIVVLSSMRHFRRK